MRSKMILWGVGCGFVGACGTLVVISSVFLLGHTGPMDRIAIAVIGLATGAGAVLLAGMMWDERQRDSNTE